MSNWLGGMALAMGLAAYFFAGLPGGQKTLPVLLRTAALGLWAYAMAMPWLSPSTIAVIRANAPRVANNFRADTRQHLFVASVAVAFLLVAWAMQRGKIARHTRFAILFSLITGSAALGRYWYKLDLLPQPDRYHLEMDMFVWVAVVFALWPLVRWAGRIWSAATSRICAILASPVTPSSSAAPRVEERLSTSKHDRVQDREVGKRTSPARRVFAPGSIGFWLNAFSDAPKSPAASTRHQQSHHAGRHLPRVRRGGPVPGDLLRSCDALIGGGKEPNSITRFHAEKLRGLTALWRDGGDAVYDLPRRSRPWRT